MRRFRWYVGRNRWDSRASTTGFGQKAGAMMTVWIPLKYFGIFFAGTIP
jgi:hypothetical protein